MAKRKNVIAPNDEKALVAMEKMAVDVQKARELYGDGEPFEEERVLDCIVFRAERAEHEAKAMGKYCQWLKMEVGHGRFLAGLERRNVEIRAAQWAMLMVEKFEDNYDTVSHLGTRKARCLTAFTKEEIDKYAKGGSLRDIPHDDVANMTTRELEQEVRTLREKQKRTEAVAKEKLRQKDEQITKMEFETKHGYSLSEKEKAEKAAETELETMHFTLYDNINRAYLHFEKALKTIEKARQLEGVTYPQLEKWVKEDYEKLAGFNELFEQLDDALNYIYVDKGDGDRS